MALNLTRSLTSCVLALWLTGCQGEPSTRATTNNAKQPDNISNNAVGTGPSISVQGQQSALKVPPEANFAGSCMGYMRIFDPAGSLSPAGQKAHELLMTLIIKKKTFKCIEYYHHTVPQSSTTLRPEKIESYRTSCLNDQSFATPDFIPDKRCGAPAIGFQELFSVYANFGAATHHENQLNSVNFIGPSPQDISTLKAGIMEIYGPEAGAVKRVYTSHFK